MKVICSNCGCIVGCSFDSGKSIVPCEWCIKVDECVANTEELEKANIQQTVILANFANKCKSHNWKGGKCEN